MERAPLRHNSPRRILSLFYILLVQSGNAFRLASPPTSSVALAEHEAEGKGHKGERQSSCRRSIIASAIAPPSSPSPRPPFFARRPSFAACKQTPSPVRQSLLPRGKRSLGSRRRSALGAQRPDESSLGRSPDPACSAVGRPPQRRSYA
ncbi:hypothetical protein GQ53DRAFT_152867 [Thozetella sp. PMI_491]|nr:hypothetical protein GQ53DRAFT_152867 [Thozetella sp. PMI_491]